MPNIQSRKTFSLLLLCATLFLTACGGLRTFHEYARAGDTVAVPIGHQPNITKDNIQVTISPSAGDDVIYNADAPEIRAVINLYPDPVSNMTVSRDIDEDTSYNSINFAQASYAIAGNDYDWYQTTVFVDLPDSLATGLTDITVSNNDDVSHTATLDILPGQGQPNTFTSNFNGGYDLDQTVMDSLARAEKTTVNLNADQIPHAIELHFSHDADKTIGGTGKATVINPTASRKNLYWHDDGVNMKIIMMPSKENVIEHMNDYKFYIAGTVSNLQFSHLNAYDSDGNELANVTANLTP